MQNHRARSIIIIFFRLPFVAHRPPPTRPSDRSTFVAIINNNVPFNDRKRHDRRVQYNGAVRGARSNDRRAADLAIHSAARNARRFRARKTVKVRLNPLFGGDDGQISKSICSKRVCFRTRSSTLAAHSLRSVYDEPFDSVTTNRLIRFRRIVFIVLNKSEIDHKKCV